MNLRKDNWKTQEENDTWDENTTNGEKVYLP